MITSQSLSTHFYPELIKGGEHFKPGAAVVHSWT
jgi:hypothetical protein